MCFFSAYGEFQNRCPFFFPFAYGEKKAATHFFACGENVAHPKSRVALLASSLAAAVAQNGYFDPNVAPAQQRNSYLMPWCVLYLQLALYSSSKQLLCCEKKCRKKRRLQHRQHEAARVAGWGDTGDGSELQFKEEEL